MKKIIISILTVVAVLTIGASVSAQTPSNTNQTAQEEASGKVIYDNLQINKVSCSNLSDNDFELLGDYYMGQMMGSSHSAMDNLMTQRIGEDNNRLMHIALGKRFSNCDSSASFPSQGVGFLPMMGMMGNWSSYDNNGSYTQPNNFNSMMGNYFGNSMMGFGYGYGAGWLGMIFMIIFWTLVIILIVVLVRGLVWQNKKSSDDNGNSAMDILKERYAKGEINKEEFKAKKKDLN